MLLQQEIFQTTDGKKLNLYHDLADHERAILLWPATMASAQSPLYGAIESPLASEGWATVCYNPRGHGGSTGVYGFATAVSDLREWMRTYPQIKRWVGVGHSGGGGGLLYVAEEVFFERLFLVAPIMDSALSLRYMKQRGSYHQFLEFLGEGVEGQKPREWLEDLSWLNIEDWRRRDLTRVLDFPTMNKFGNRFVSLAEMLPGIFIPSHITWSLLEAQKKRATIVLPQDDAWFPIDKTRQFASAHGIQVVQPIEAQEHFLRGAWPSVWQCLRETVRKATEPYGQLDH